MPSDVELKKGCKHKWTDSPGVEYDKCPECGNENLQCCKTDQYDYCFIVWQPDMPPAQETTMSFINTYGEEVRACP